MCVCRCVLGDMGRKREGIAMKGVAEVVWWS